MIRRAIATAIMTTAITTAFSAAPRTDTISTKHPLIKDWYPGILPTSDESEFIVRHGIDSLSGEPLYWNATWWPDNTDEPGILRDSTEPSAWKLINSKSFNDETEPTWIGWNSNAPKAITVRKPGSYTAKDSIIGNWGSQIDSADIGVYLPTWKNGAEGAYTIVHNDVGILDMQSQLIPAVEILNDYPNIPVAWGVVGSEMSEAEWLFAVDQCYYNNHHEIVSHGWDNSSAGDIWKVFYEGDTIPVTDMDIPKELRGLVVSDITGSTKTVEGIFVEKSYLNGDKDQPVFDTTKTEYAVSTDYQFDSLLLTDLGLTVDPSVALPDYIYSSKGELDASDMVWSDVASKNVPAVKILCSNGWFGDENREMVIIEDSKSAIDQHVYTPIGKETTFFTYNDGISAHQTHERLRQSGYLGAAGDQARYDVNSNDFYNTFHIKSDRFFMGNEDGTSVYPDNPYQYLTLQGMVDRIIATKGYAIREFAGVQSNGGWVSVDFLPTQYSAGMISENLYRDHLHYLSKKIDSNELVVMTPSEAIKYRKTRDAVQSMTFDYLDTLSEDAGVEFFVQFEVDSIPDEYKTEISLIVKDNSAFFDICAIRYSDTVVHVSPDRFFDQDGYSWSVPVDPFRGPISVVTQRKETEVQKPELANTRTIAINGIQNGTLALSLPTGNFTAEIFSVSGRKLMTKSLVGGSAKAAEITTNGLGSGMFLLSVKQNGSALFQEKFLVQ